MIGFAYSEQRMIAAIRRMPAGTVRREGCHDPIPGMPDGVPVNVDVTVDPAAAMIDVDLRDNLDCQPCGLNLTEATARTAAMMGVFTGLGTVVPPNARSFRRLSVHLRENCVVGIPRHPTSCSAATTDLSELTAGLVALALGDLGEGFGLAQVGRAQPASMAVISGTDPRPQGGAFVNQLILAVTGGSGAPAADGWLTILGIGAAGFLYRDSVEIDEMKYPIVVHEQRIVPDSEGAGRFRGSPGALVVFGPIDGCELDLIYLSDGTFNASEGVRGGGPGGKASQRKRSADGSSIWRARLVRPAASRSGRADRRPHLRWGRVRAAASSRGCACGLRRRRGVDHERARVRGVWSARRCRWEGRRGGDYRAAAGAR